MVVAASAEAKREGGKFRPAHSAGVEARIMPSERRTITSPVKRVGALPAVPLIKSSWFVSKNWVPLSMAVSRELTDWVREASCAADWRGSTLEV
jgi:hypothetical protein